MHSLFEAVWSRMDKKLHLQKHNTGGNAKKACFNIEVTFPSNSGPFLLAHSS